jgi:catechol 2,3-dioxygenase-like lactoylglutathione lyase family enzyme
MLLVEEITAKEAFCGDAWALLDIRRSKSAGVKFFSDRHDGIYGLTIYIADPDGNMIELYEADAKM